MCHSPLQQTWIFEVVLQASLQLTEIVVQTDSLKVNLKMVISISFDTFKMFGSIECANTPQISKIHPNKKSPAYDVGVGNKTPIT